MSQNISMTLYYKEVRQNAQNTYYPCKIEVHDSKDLERVIVWDHVCAEYNNFHRSNADFIQADCNMFDVDNTESDDPADWKKPDDVKAAFPNVAFYVSFSRNHMKPKKGKAPRPKFHVYFPDVTITNSEQYKDLKQKVCSYFSAFDPNAKDSARFFYGVEEPKVEYYPGDMLLSDFMKSVSINKINEEKQISRYTSKNTDVIPEGRRNSTLFKYARRALIRWGNTSDKAYQKFILESEKCVPKLDGKELDSIWNSALKYYQNTIKVSPNYISPDLYGDLKPAKSLKPEDYTDIGQTRVFVREYGRVIRFSLATNYLFYTGKVWIEDELKVHGLAQNLTELQLKEACSELKKAQKIENDSTINGDNFEKKNAKTAIRLAEQYRKHALSSRHTLRIGAMLKETKPMVEIDVSYLDADGFLLNTPAGTVDLRENKLCPHNPTDYCTKITKVSPTNKGADLFSAFLEVITCGDKPLEDYLQIISGMCAVGKVFCENLIIAYGSGRNGKSTFFNLLARVMGDYSGRLSSEILTANCRQNKSPEYAELRGKRLVVASELEQDMRLDTAIVKKLCSTDPIYAEKKYKDPFSFIPSHTVVLCTNHLPRVETTDWGTWRRLIVVPFNAVIEGNEEVKNYADYLFDNAGEAVLSWIIEGARKFVEANYKVESPSIVKQAIGSYQAENDWINNFISERCEVDKSFVQISSTLYYDYKDYCKCNGEHTYSASAFKKALEEKGFKYDRNNKNRVFCGLRLLTEIENPLVSVAPFPRVTDGDSEIQDFSEEEIKF